MTEATNTPQGESIRSLSSYDTLKTFVMDNMKGNIRRQSELAELSGLSTATVSRAKRGHIDVTLNVYRALALAIKRQDKLAMQEFEAEDAVSLAPAPDLVAMAENVPQEDDDDLVDASFDVIKVGDTVWVKGVFIKDDGTDVIPLKIMSSSSGITYFYERQDVHRAPSPSDQSAEIERLKAEIEKLTKHKAFWMGIAKSFSDSLEKINDEVNEALSS